MKPDELKQEIFMRFIILSILLFISNFIVAQDAKTIQEINALIGPKFHFDTSNNNYGDDFYAVEKSNGNIIVNAWDTGFDNQNPLSKVFVFKRNHEKLTIVDSSAAFERDGMGPHVNITNDTIVIEHSCHGCTDENTYLFSNKKQKYLLVSLAYTEVTRSSKPSQGNVPVGIKKKFYTISNQESTTEIWNDDETKLKSKKIIKKPLPKNFIPDLAHYIDPEGDEYDIYSKIF